MTEYNTAAEAFRQKAEAFIKDTAERIARICKRNDVPTDAAEAFTADVVDMLHADYKGLCATTEQMRMLTDKVSKRSWERTENAAICFMAKYYGKIVQEMDGRHVIELFLTDGIVYKEVAVRQSTTTAEIMNKWGNSDIQITEAEVVARIQQWYYTIAMLTIGEHTDVEAAELMAAPCNCKIEEERKQRLIEIALQTQRQRKSIEARKQEGKKRTKEAEDNTPTLFHGGKTIMLYQNMLNMISGGIKTADMDENGQSKVLRPLRQAIREQREAAQEVLNDSNATELQKAKATQLLATTTGVGQAMDALQIIPQTLQPDASGDTYTRYDLTPYQLAQISAGQAQPNSNTITNCMRAFAWLSTQRMQLFETAERITTEKGADGKIKRDENGKPIKHAVQRTICTNFQPLIIEFRSEYEDNVLIENATRVRLRIHDVIQKGRSADYYIEKTNGRELRLCMKQPTTHVIQLRQFYDFTSDEERIFRNILISKPKLAEDKLLAAVFDYKARQEEYDKEAQKKKHIAEEASAGSMDVVQKEAQKAEDKAKYYITNHMGDDVKRLKEMFAKAKDNGLIVRYSRDEAKTIKARKKYGSGYVWTWERPKADEVKKRKIKWQNWKTAR